MGVAAERDQVEAEFSARERRWRPRARYVHDLELPPGTWTVDDQVQAEPLTEASLEALLLREGMGKKEVRVSAPLHIALAGIIGFFPAYSSSSAAGV